jgi:hypothetical protein
MTKSNFIPIDKELVNDHDSPLVELSQNSVVQRSSQNNGIDLTLFSLIDCPNCNKENYVSKKCGTKFILCNNSGCRRILIVQSHTKI